MISWRKLFSIISIILLFLVIVSIVNHFHRKVYIDLFGKTIVVEVSETKEALEKGLSGHEPLSSDQGMLFVFSKPEKYGFWMKDMTFPIDIVWVDQNFNIVHIEESVLPETYPKVFYPKEPALYVLEVYSGQALNLGLKIGQSIKIYKK